MIGGESEMGKKISDLVLCFSSSFAYSEVAKVWPIIQTANRTTIERSPNVAAIRLVAYRSEDAHGRHNREET